MSEFPTDSTADRTEAQCAPNKPATMKAAIQTAYAQDVKSVVRVETNVPVPTPGAGEVLIKVHAAAVNPVDYKLIQGSAEKVIKRTFPFTLGFDVAGEIMCIGEGVTKFKIGDQVYADLAKQNGSFAEYAIGKETAVGLKPSNLSFTEAAGVPLVTLTSYQALVKYGKIVPGKERQKVLVLGATGGTGVMGVQLAKAFGCHVAAVCSGRNSTFATQCGADQVIDYTTQDWGQVLKGAEYDCIYDTVGGKEQWDKAQQVLKKTGHFVTIAGDKQGKVTFGSIASMAASVMNRKFWSLFGNPNYSAFLTDANAPADLDAITKLIENGKVKSYVERTFQLTTESIHEMFDGIMSHKTRGKLVIQVTPDPEFEGPNVPTSTSTAATGEQKTNEEQK